MKFGKALAAQMVPEWQNAYIDYSYLKTALKDIIILRLKNESLPVSGTPNGSLKRKESLYRAFSGLTSRYNKVSSNKDREDEVILVSSKQQHGYEENYRTTLMISSEGSGDYEQMFFYRLDEEFNKVLKFYKGKVEEVIKEAEKLSRQMDALIALRIKVEDPMELRGADGNASSEALSAGWLRLAQAQAALKEQNYEDRSSQKNSRISLLDVIEELEVNSEENLGDEMEPEKEPRKKANRGNADNGGFNPASTEVLNHVKMNVEPETPVSTLKNVLKSLNSDFSFNKKELIKVEEQMKLAFIEFYQKLRFLKSYCWHYPKS